MPCIGKYGLLGHQGYDLETAAVRSPNTRHGAHSKFNEGRILCLFTPCSPGQKKVEDL